LTRILCHPKWGTILDPLETLVWRGNPNVLSDPAPRWLEQKWTEVFSTSPSLELVGVETTWEHQRPPSYFHVRLSSLVFDTCSQSRAGQTLLWPCAPVSYRLFSSAPPCILPWEGILRFKCFAAQAFPAAHSRPVSRPITPYGDDGQYSTSFVLGGGGVLYLHTIPVSNCI
jgi:hypothetical protein